MMESVPMATGEVSVLVVEDEDISRLLLWRSLNQEGYRVTVATTGEEAVECLDRAAFDLVLLDIEMPGMNGLEVLMHIRQTHSLSDLPVIVVSARNQTGDMVATLRLGANDYVAKPLHFP